MTEVIPEDSFEMTQADKQSYDAAKASWESENRGLRFEDLPRRSRFYRWQIEKSIGLTAAIRRPS